ncbi:MAG: hypothetical protein AAF518_05895 [Spirochaetota bacterium]
MKQDLAACSAADLASYVLQKEKEDSMEVAEIILMIGVWTDLFLPVWVVLVKVISLLKNFICKSAEKTFKSFPLVLLLSFGYAFFSAFGLVTLDIKSKDRERIYLRYKKPTINYQHLNWLKADGAACKQEKDAIVINYWQTPVLQDTSLPISQAKLKDLCRANVAKELPPFVKYYSQLFTGSVEHAVVYIRSKPWLTVTKKTELSKEDLEDSCRVKVVLQGIGTESKNKVIMIDGLTPEMPSPDAESLQKQNLP